jgi:hypothetical protein
VDDDFDSLVRHVEEEVRLDQLEPFVRQGRRVDGDLGAHAPGRVRESVGAGHVGELFPCPAAEWAAGGGQDDGVDGLWAAALEALVERRVLAVDRQEEASPTLSSGQCELPRRHEALLVGERERDAALEGPERCR